MNTFNLKTPVLFLLFNRPDTTLQVFGAIRKARPKQLFIACDGPRKEKNGEEENVQEVKNIVSRIDWACEIKTLFREKNLGCEIAVSTAIDWFFEHVEEGIILEDDCLPDQSFFQFCEEMLDFYRNNDKIMHISGDNFLFGKNQTPYSYYFSIFNHVWGWATWRRAWKNFDFEMILLQKIGVSNFINTIFTDHSTRKYWKSIFQSVQKNKINSWDYRWTFSCWKEKGLTIIPQVNLVSNIGFGERSTHTKNANNPFANLPTKEIRFPLKHPLNIERNEQSDQFVQKYHFNPNLLQKIKRKLLSIKKEILSIMQENM